MQCIRCNTDFCYRCGDKLRTVKFFGDHYSKYSIFGCKYRYKPNQPLQRKFVRGTIFGGKLIIFPVLSALGLGAGAVVLVLGVAALPLVGGVRVYRRVRHATSNSRLSLARLIRRNRRRQEQQQDSESGDEYLETKESNVEMKSKEIARVADEEERNGKSMVHILGHNEPIDPNEMTIYPRSIGRIHRLVPLVSSNDVHRLEEIDANSALIFRYIHRNNIPDHPMVLPFEIVKRNRQDN